MLDEVTSILLLRNVQNNALYIVNKKYTNMYENEDADQLRGNSVTDQLLCSHTGKPIKLILVTTIHQQACASQCT